MKTKNKICRNKKAEFNMVIAIVISLVVIVLVSFILYNFYLSMKSKLEVQSCHDSVAAHSAIAVGSSRDYFTDIKCPTKTITVDNTNQLTAEKAMAEDMHKCWYEWQQGNAQLFKGDGVFCHVCSVYTFKDKSTALNGFAQYLAKQPIAISYPGDTPGISYIDYLKGYKTKNTDLVNNAEMQKLVNGDAIATSQDYASIFVYASGKEGIQKTLEGSRGGLATVSSLAIFGGITSGGIALGAIAIGSNPVGWIIGSAGLVTIGTIGLYNALFNTENPEWVSFIVFKPYTNQELQNIGCEQLPVNQQSASKP